MVLLAGIAVATLSACGSDTVDASRATATSSRAATSAPAETPRGTVLASFPFNVDSANDRYVLGDPKGEPLLHNLDGSPVEWFPVGPGLSVAVDAYLTANGLYVRGKTVAGGLQDGDPVVASLSLEDGKPIWSRSSDEFDLVGATDQYGLLQSQDAPYSFLALSAEGREEFRTTPTDVDEGVVRLDSGAFVTDTAGENHLFLERDVSNGEVLNTIVADTSTELPPEGADISTLDTLIFPIRGGGYIAYADGPIRRVSQGGAEVWNLGAAEGVVKAASDERVAVFGPTGDLVILDASDGSTIGDPIKTTGTTLEGCDEDRGYFIDSERLVLNCKRGGGIRSAVLVAV